MGLGKMVEIGAKFSEIDYNFPGLTVVYSLWENVMLHPQLKKIV